MHRLAYSYLLSAIGRFAFAILWNVFVGGIAYFVMPAKHPLLIKVVLGFFLLLGPLMLWGTLRGLVLAMRYRTAVFVADRLPVRVGEVLTGRLTWANMPRGELRVSLVCTAWQGKYRDVVWREDRDVPAVSILHGEMETSVPVAFRVPPDAPSGGRHSWTLETMIGHEFASRFEIPVLRNA